MRGIKQIGCFAAVCLASGLLPAPAMAATVYEMKAAHWTPSSSKFHRAYSNFAKEVEARSKGRIKITVHPAGAFGPPTAHHSLLMGGTIDFAMMVFEFFPGKYPVSEMLELPFINSDDTIHWKAAHEIIKRGRMDKLWYEEAHPIFAGGTKAYQAMTVKKRIVIPKDVAGLKLRKSTGTLTQSLEALGATVLPISFSDMHGALQRGIIDGLFYDYTSTVDGNAVEFIKHVTEISSARAFIAFEMSKKTYERLPKDLQKVIDDAADPSFLFTLQDMEATEVRSKAALVKAGATIRQATPEEMKEWRNAFKPAWDHWIKKMDGLGIDGRRLLQEYGQIVKSLGGTWLYEY